jgi:hypothetical protein
MPRPPGRISPVGTLVTYFAAPSDEVAAGLVVTGPSVEHPVSKALQTAYQANDPTATRLMYKADVGLATEGVYALDVKVMPATELVTLEALLTGRERDEVERNPRVARMPQREEGPPLASVDLDYGPWVVTVTDELRDALCAADARQRAAVAYQWAESGDFGGADGEDLAYTVDRLAELARIAQLRSEHLYC